MLSRFFIHRPIFAIVLSVFIILVGVLAIVTLPVAEFPPITPPTIQVQATYIGANATVVEKSVATAIENQVVGVDNLIYMQSTSTSNGLYTLNCTFSIGSSIEQALIDVENRVQQATGQLPSQVTSLGISIQKRSPQLLMAVTLFSPDGSYDPVFLSNYATINMINPLLSVKGIGSDNVIGQFNYAMRSWVCDRTNSAKLGLQAKRPRARDPYPELAHAYRCGRSAAHGQEYAVPALGQHANAAGEREPVRRHRGQDEPRWFDSPPLGRVARGVGRGAVRHDRPIRNASGNGHSAVSDAGSGTPFKPPITYARFTLESLKKQFPPGVDYAVAYDSTLFVTSSIRDVISTLFIAIFLVILVVLVFLGSLRTSFIPMLAVPVSLIGTFGAFVLLGFSINTLTLFGLVLAIGLVVDDAIVVVEAVEHHIEEGMNTVAATELAMQQLTGPVVAVALVLIAVFLPSAFIQGLTGQLYRQFALTLSVSVSISAIVALTLTPALCTVILKGKPGRLWGPFGWFIDRFNVLFGKVTDGYIGSLRWLLRRSVIVMLILALFYVADGYMAVKIPGGFIPTEDQGVIFVQIQNPYGTSLNKNAQLADRIEEDINKIPGVQDVITLGGFNLLSSISTSDSSSLIVTLLPWDKRKSKELSLRTIALTIYQHLNKYPQVFAFPFVPPTIQGLGVASGFQFELEDLSGHSIADLSAVAAKVMAAAEKRPELTGLRTTERASVPQIQLELDRNKTKQLGVNPSDVFENLQAYLGGLVVNQFTLFDRTWQVMIQAEPDFRADSKSISQIFVRNNNGAMVPVSTVASWKHGLGADMIQRFNTNREVEIFGSNSENYSSGQAIAAMQEVAKQTLPRGYGYGWTGTSYQQVIVGNTQSIIFALSILLVFLFLAAQYESWLLPAAVLAGVPIGIFGAFLSVTLWRLDMDIYVQIGLIMLIGLAAKNAILIVEFARERRAEGVPIMQAALEGAHLRFRPILMTSFAFIIGVVPLMITSGAGAASRHSLGSAVFGGMLVATCVGVFFIPTLFMLVQGLIERGKPHSETLAEPATRPQGGPA